LHSETSGGLAETLYSMQKSISLKFKLTFGIRIGFFDAYSANLLILREFGASSCTIPNENTDFRTPLRPGIRPNCLISERKNINQLAKKKATTSFK